MKMPKMFRSRLLRVFEMFERALPTAAVALQVVDGLRGLFGTERVETAQQQPNPGTYVDPDDGWEIVFQTTFRADDPGQQIFSEFADGDRIIVMRREREEFP